LDPKEGQYHSAQEAKAAINGLPEGYWLRLRRWVTWQLSGNCIAAVDDVIADIWERFIRGTRHWPRGVSIETCFKNAVKSEISSVWDKHSRAVAQRPAPVTTDGEQEDPLENIEGPIRDPLVEIIAGAESKRLQNIADHICDHFRSDAAVMALISGRDRQMSPDDVQQEYGLTQTEYDSASKRLRRFINKHYPNGWGSYGNE
jgi:RNA polymerase sigma-70 factor (ECF subfamily)